MPMVKIMPHIHLLMQISNVFLFCMTKHQLLYKQEKGEGCLYDLVHKKMFEIPKTFSYALHTTAIQKIISYKLGQVWSMQLGNTWLGKDARPYL